MMRNWKGGVLAVLLTTVLLFVYYSHQITGADHITYGMWGDGYKNYYTLAYYLQHDTGAHFSGMNYPFGENVLFTDNQPAVAFILKGLCHLFPGIAYHIHGFIALAFFFSLLLSAVFIYKTFIELAVDEYVAAIFATLIVLLSPQIQRLGGHFSLSYSFYIPAIIYWLVRFLKTGGATRYFLTLLIFNSFFVFIHIYYAAMSALFILMVALVYAYANRTNLRAHIKTLAYLGAVAITPFVLLKGFLFFTDNITDRPKAPWGFVENRATVADILLSANSFTGKAIVKLFPHAKIVYHFEGLGYIGLVTVLILLGTGFWTLNSLRKKQNPFNSIYPFNLFVIPALVVLLFALAFPFCFDFMEKYYAKMPAAIKQFRASGRFNWYFFYTATMLSVIVLYRLFKTLLGKNKPLAYSLLIAAISIWFIEANMISNHMGEDFKNESLNLDEKQLTIDLKSQLQKVGKQASDFQGIMPIPFFLNGSEKLYIESSVSYDAMKVSLFTGLPVVCGQLSRTSQSETFLMANLLSGPLIKKDILKLYNNKPLLLITQGTDLTLEEKTLLAKAHYLFTEQNLKYFQLDLSAFKDSIEETKKYVADNPSNFYNHGHYVSTDSFDNVLIKRYEDEPKNYAVFGKGAHYSEHDLIYFHFDTLPQAKDSVTYEVSYWVYTDSRRAAYPVVYMTQLDPKGNEVSKAENNAKFSTNIYKDWVRGTFDFVLTGSKNKVLLTGAGDYATFDEVMIRPKNVNVITQHDNDSTFIFNNFPIR